MDWLEFGRVSRMLYFVRVPIAILILVAALGPFANTSTLLENLLELSEYPSDIFQVSLGVFLLGYAAVAAIDLVFFYGDRRFSERLFTKKHRPGFIFSLGTIAPAIFMYSVVQRTEQPSWLSALIALAGFGAAVTLVILGDLFQLYLTDSKVNVQRFAVFPAKLLGARKSISARLLPP